MIQYLQCRELLLVSKVQTLTKFGVRQFLELLRKDIEADKIMMMTALVALTDEQGTAH